MHIHAHTNTHAYTQHEVESVLEARRQLTAAQDALDTCEAELEFVTEELVDTGPSGTRCGAGDPLGCLSISVE
ncbi:MAG: hypothetical protein ACK559_42055, partial [bacterium]